MLRTLRKYMEHFRDIIKSAICVYISERQRMTTFIADTARKWSRGKTIVPLDTTTVSRFPINERT
jgi:hypothetical protein